MSIITVSQEPVNQLIPSYGSYIISDTYKTVDKENQTIVLLDNNKIKVGLGNGITTDSNGIAVFPSNSSISVGVLGIKANIDNDTLILNSSGTIENNKRIPYVEYGNTVMYDIPTSLTTIKYSYDVSTNSNYSTINTDRDKITIVRPGYCIITCKIEIGRQNITSRECMEARLLLNTTIIERTYLDYDSSTTANPLMWIPLLMISQQQVVAGDIISVLIKQDHSGKYTIYGSNTSTNCKLRITWLR